MSTITIALPDDSIRELQRMADGLGRSVEDLAREGVESMIMARRDRFRSAADYVLDKNAELYRRLAQ